MRITQLIPVLIVAASAITGCVNGSRQMSSMTAQDLRSHLVIGITTMEDVRQMLGEPQSKGVRDFQLLWYYRYQKLSARFFVPFIPPSRAADIQGFLEVSFDDKNVVSHVDYRGDR